MNNVANVQAEYNEYDKRSTSADFRASRAKQTTTGRLNRADRPENDPFKTELEYGQPATVGQHNQGPWVGAQSKRRKKVNHKNSAAYKAGKLWARTRVSAINGWVGAWVIFWYLAFQLPFAILSTVGIGASAAVYSYINDNIVEPVEGVTGIDLNGFFVNMTSGITNVISQISDFLFGIPFDPFTIFIVPFVLIFLLTVFQLILAWFIYNLAGIKSLSGERGGIKNTMFLIAGVGVTIPFLNLLPLIFLWMLVVWKYPK